MRYKVRQGPQTEWEIDHQYVRYLVYGIWIQSGQSIEEAGRVAEWVIGELMTVGRAEFHAGNHFYQIISA